MECGYRRTRQAFVCRRRKREKKEGRGRTEGVDPSERWMIRVPTETRHGGCRVEEKEREVKRKSTNKKKQEAGKMQKKKENKELATNRQIEKPQDWLGVAARCGEAQTVKTLDKRQETDADRQQKRGTILDWIGGTGKRGRNWRPSQEPTLLNVIRYVPPAPSPGIC